MTTQLRAWRDERRGAPLMYHGPSDEFYRVYDYAEAMSGRLVGRANMDAFRAALKAIEDRHDAEGIAHLDAEGEPDHCFRHEFFGGAFGRGEWLFVNPACADSVAEAQRILAALDDYPIVDEDLLSEVESAEIHETAEQALYEIAPADERGEAASYVVQWAAAARHRRRDLYNDRDERDPYEDPEQWWPSKRALFWGYVNYRRSLRSA